MTIQTELTRHDWSAFVRYVTQARAREGKSRRLRWASSLGLGLIVGGGLALSGQGFDLLSFFAGVLAGVVWLMILSRLQMRMMGPSGQGYILGPRQVSLTEEGIGETSSLHQSLFRWSVVRSAAVAPQHVFVLVDRNAAIIVPRRAFASEVEREQFVEEVKRRATGPKGRE
ncbi:MAG: YcxB family protein [Verrucomicrobiota bacterium]